MTSPIVVPHWRIITDPPEQVDGIYHVVYTGVYAPATGCGIHRGRPAKTWHEEEDPATEVRCEPCVDSMVPEESP